MHGEFVDLFGRNLVIASIANLFALLAGVGLLWSVGRKAYFFARDVIAKGISTAAHAVAERRHAAIAACAADIHYQLAYSLEALGQALLWTVGSVAAFLSMFLVADGQPQRGGVEGALVVATGACGCFLAMAAALEFGSLIRVSKAVRAVISSRLRKQDGS